MKKLIIAIVVIIFVVISAFAYYTYNKKQYRDKVAFTANTMLNVASMCEDITGRYYQIWAESISSGIWAYKGHVIDKEERRARIYPLDSMELIGLETAILYIREENEKKVQLIKEDVITLETQIADLNNPPNQYKEIYNETIECYGYVREYARLTESPNGNLISFSQKINSLSSEIFKKVTEIKARNQ